jgi:hypothetical protein
MVWTRFGENSEPLLRYDSGGVRAGFDRLKVGRPSNIMTDRPDYCSCTEVTYLYVVVDGIASWPWLITTWDRIHLSVVGTLRWNKLSIWHYQDKRNKMCGVRIEVQIVRIAKWIELYTMQQA